MTETEARQFVEELHKLIRTYEKATSSRIDYTAEQVYKGPSLAWLNIKGITLKVDPPK